MKRIVFFLSVAASLIISGCANDDDSLDNGQVPVKPLKREWYKVVKTDTLSNVRITQEISGYALAIGKTIIRKSFLYHSLNGSDTLTLSGAVCWPIETDCYSEIWLESHFFTTRWDECPSQLAQPGMIVSSRRNAIYIGADYQGLGLSRNLNPPYLNTPMLANQNIDCFKAAMTLIRDCGPELNQDYYTYNVGFSLGGAVAMGIAKQIETDPDLKAFINLKKTFCGGGPYDQVAYFNHCLKTPGQSLDYPIAIICAIRSITNSSTEFRQKHDFSECISDKLLNSGIVEALDTRNYNTGTINEMLSKVGCTSLDQILSAELLDPNTQIFKDVFKEISKLDLTTGWTPRSPILVHHSRTDTYVPFACMESVLANMSDNPNVTCEINESAGHEEDGIRLYLNIALGNYSFE